jgi:hypothetical protein
MNADSKTGMKGANMMTTYAYVVNEEKVESILLKSFFLYRVFFASGSDM